MSRANALRRLEAVEAQLEAREQAKGNALLDRMTLEELDELERLMEAGDEQALDALYRRLEQAYGSGAGV